jgi:hypothetical protein
MTIGTLTVALIWGSLCGYMILRILDSFAGLAVCLHGLSLSRRPQTDKKKRAANPEVIKKLMLQLSAYALGFALCLYLGDKVIQRQLFFTYEGTNGIVWAAVALVTGLSRIPTSRRRVALIRRLSHEHGYAEKRSRTHLLKG